MISNRRKWDFTSTQIYICRAETDWSMLGEQYHLDRSGPEMAKPGENSTISLTHQELERMDARELTEIAKEDDLCLRFASEEYGYYLTYSQTRDEVVVVYAGPHGPENRPASISNRNFELLINECEQISVVELDNTPYADHK